MTSSTNQHVGIARGILLLGVFHIHAVYALLDHLADAETVHMARLQLKILAPNVVIFFALSGMTSKALADNSVVIVAKRSLMLILVAFFSHVIGLLLEYALWKPWTSMHSVLREIAKPIILGVGFSTFVAWFFIVLAIVRALAFLLSRNVRAFVAVTAIAVAAIVASMRLGLSDNLYEWRNWPAALLMFMLGIRVSPGWRAPNRLGLAASIASIVLALLNRPTVWTKGLCVDCDPLFVAQPMIGGYGFLPIYLVQEVLALVGLLWLAGLVANTPIGTALAWVGRRSIQLLLLHGWIVLSVFGVAGYLAPLATGAPLFIAVFVMNTLLHVVLYGVFAKPLGRFILACSALSRKLVAIAQSIARAARRAVASA